VLPRTIIVAFAVGIVTTIVASIGPALRASRVPPIAAIREAEPAAYRRSLRRTISGALVTLAGVGALLAALFGNVGGAKLVGLGTALVFLGVAILSPLMAGPLARIIGAPLPSISGVAGKLGRENAMRNPKRTASTAAALMIGLGLISFVSIFAASIKASAFQALEQTLKADYIVSTSTFSMGFSQDVAAQLRMDPSFGGVEEFRLGVFGYKGQAQNLFGVDPATLTAVAEVPMQSGSLSALGDGDLLVFKQTAESNGWKLGDMVPVEFTRTGKQELRIVGIYTDNRLLKDYVVSLGTYERNYTQQLDTFVLVKTAPGVTLAQAKRSVDRVAKSFPNVKLEDQAQFRQSQSNQINQVLGLITALLGLAIIIALFGIVNTLALSVFERTREIGLLRAVGMARRQVRTMIRWEAVIIAVFGAILGVAVGIFFGWAMIQALRDQGATILSLPAGQLVFTVVAAGIMGLIAAVLPARRAARLDVLQAIAQE
jgi:putative ABC transport system permease protein